MEEKKDIIREKRVRGDNVRDMTRGGPAGLILCFALPLMLGNMFQQLYTVVDTAVVGKVLGVDALAALGAIEWVNWMALGMIQGLTQGFSILIAREFGAKRFERLRSVLWNSIVLCAVLAAVMLVIMELAAGPAIRFLHVPENIRPMATSYLRIMYGGIPIMMIYNEEASVLRALGDGRTPLYACVIASFVNIALDCLFVIVFGWGVEGAAVATLLAQVLASVYCFVRIRGIGILKKEAGEVHRTEPETCTVLMKLGMPITFQFAVISIGGIIVMAVVNKLGVIFIAGMTAVNKLYGLLEVAATSYGFAMVTYTGQNMGAGQYDRISKGTGTGLVIGLITSAVITAVMILFARPILGFFITEETEGGAEAIGVAVEYLTIMAGTLSVLYILHIVRSCIQGMGNTFIPMLSGIGELIMRTGASVLLPVLFGARAIMWAEPLAWLGADLILVPGYFLVRRKISKEAAK